MTVTATRLTSQGEVIPPDMQRTTVAGDAELATPAS
jgi:hypothetical protein